MPSTLAIELAATGNTINVLIPIIAGVLLVLGIVAIVITSIRRRKLAAPKPAAAPADPAVAPEAPAEEPPA